MKHQHHLLVVLVDGEHARFVVPGKAAGAFRTMSSVSSPAMHQKSSDLESDRLGRSFESGSVTRHAIAPHNDPHEIQKQRFVRAIADRTNQMVLEHKYDMLVLVAPAHALNELRARLHQPVLARLAGTLTHDLLKVPDQDLAEHLKEWAQPAQVPQD